MATPPKTMKLVSQPDPASSHLILTNGPIPTPVSPDDHLVRIKACSPTRHELTWETADPHIFPNGRPTPRTPCFDGSGIVVTSSPSSAFKTGDEVFFNVHHERNGCIAEYTIVKTHEMVLKPKGVSFEDAATVGISGMTAWQGLFVHGGLRSPGGEGNGDAKVLITGAAGSVGSYAVQLALAAGLHVAAFVSPSKTEVAQSLGATKVLTQTPLLEDEQYDLIFDTVGGSVLRACWDTVRDDGTSIILSVSADQPDDQKPENAKSVKMSKWFLVETEQQQLREIARLMEEGKLKALVDGVYEMERFKETFEKVHNGSPKGKVVIKVD